MLNYSSECKIELIKIEWKTIREEWKLKKIRMRKWRTEKETTHWRTWKTKRNEIRDWARLRNWE